MLATRNRIVPWPIVSSGLWRDSEPTNGRTHFDNRMTWAPSASVVETDNAFLLRLEVPGVSPDSISVDLDGMHLVVTGEREPLTTASDEKVILSEMPWGHFTRRFRLGAEVDRDSVSATYHNGILEIEAPKSMEARPRRIPVTVSS